MLKITFLLNEIPLTRLHMQSLKESKKEIIFACTNCTTRSNKMSSALDTRGTKKAPSSHFFTSAFSL